MENISAEPISIEEVVRVLGSYGIHVTAKNVENTATSLIYELAVDAHFRFNTLRARSKDIAVVLGQSFRVLAPYKKGSIGMEFPPLPRLSLHLEDYLPQLPKGLPALSIPLGSPAGGAVKLLDLAKGPHLLVAGASGSGKSTYLRTIIETLRRRNTPQDVRISLVDIKRLDFAAYEGDAFLYNPFRAHSVITDPKQARGLFDAYVKEVYSRLEILKNAGVKDLAAFNRISNKKMPYLVLVVDEYAELLMAAGNAKAEIEENIQRLGQLARATGIHLVLATQRPDAETVSSAIKANFPCRIAFPMPSKRDYMTVLDCCPPVMEKEPKGSAWVKLPDMGGVFQIQAPLAPEHIELMAPKQASQDTVVTAYKETIPGVQNSFPVTELWAWFVRTLYVNEGSFSTGTILCATSGQYLFDFDQDGLFFGFTRPQWDEVMKHGEKVGFLKSSVNGSHMANIGSFLEYAKSDILRIKKWDETATHEFQPTAGWMEKMIELQEKRNKEKQA